VSSLLLLLLLLLLQDGVISGPEAFQLWDSFGFPVDLTQLMAEEHGLRVRLLPLYYSDCMVCNCFLWCWLMLLGVDC
jgi:hypothetical protein